MSRSRVGSRPATPAAPRRARPGLDRGLRRRRVTASCTLTGLLGHLRTGPAACRASGRSGLLGVLVLVPIGAGIYAVRRYRDAKEHRADALPPLVPRRADRAAQPAVPRRRLRPDAEVDPAPQRTHRGAVRRPRGRSRRSTTPTAPRSATSSLVAVAARLVEAIGPDDRAVRYGGDQFVLFCPDVSTTTVGRAHRQVGAGLHRDAVRGGRHAGAPVGRHRVAITEERCTRPDEVLRDADAALHQAKQIGPGALHAVRPGHA